MPQSIEEARRFAHFDPIELADVITDDEALVIYQAWVKARSIPGVPRANEQSQKTYCANGTMLELKYASASNVSYTDFSPIDFVKAFFRHSKFNGRPTYKIYRFSLLHYLNQRLTQLAQTGIPQPSLIKALAVLIIKSGYPYEIPTRVARVDIRAGRESGAKSITASKFEELTNYLATGYPRQNKNAVRAQIMALATMATGLRPTEWKNSTLRDATSNEVPEGEDPQNWLALVVKTAKRKNNEQEWIRTLLIPPGVQQIHIRRHRKMIQDLVDPSADPNSDETDRYINKAMTTALTRACKELWPSRPQDWVTMYTFRSQARANFTRLHGKFIAAAMLGHSVDKSEDFYAGSHRANLTSGEKNKESYAIPQPGLDVLERANAMMLQPARRVLKQRERNEQRVRETLA